MSRTPFVADDVEFFPIDEGRGVAFNPRNFCTCELTTADYNLLLTCDRMLKLEQHVVEIIQRGDHAGRTEREIKQALLEMLSTGLMLSPEQAVRQIERGGPEVHLTTSWHRGWTLGIASADRPELLERVLNSALPYLQELEVKPRFVLADDSRDKRAGAANRASVEQFASRCGLEYEYWDRAGRERLAREFAEELPRCRESIDYLLSPSAHDVGKTTTGQARNLILMRSAGTPLLMVDDDCVIRPVCENGYRKTEVGIAYSGRNATPSASLEQLFSGLVECDLNPFREHLERLGNLSCDLLARGEGAASDPARWIGGNGEDLHALLQGEFVGTTINGIAGALNLRQMNWFYRLYGHAQESAVELLDSVAPDAVLEQAAWTGGKRDEIGRGAALIGTTIFGIAPFSLLPPLIPVGRNEDIVWGESIKMIYPQSRPCLFGWGLAHLPEPKRDWRPFDAQQEPPFRAEALLINLIMKFADQCPHREALQRLGFLESNLRRMVGREGEIAVKEILLQHHSEAVVAFERSASTVTASPAYQQGCRKMEAYHMRMLGELDRDLQPILRELEALITPFASLLGDWPQLWARCGEGETQQ